MKIIDLLNMAADDKADVYNTYFMFGNEKHNLYRFFDSYVLDFTSLNFEIEIIDDILENEEKKIPEKLDMILLGQENNWTQKFNVKTKEMETTGIELNPYILEIINTNTLEIQNRFNQLIDYLKSKGE